MIQLNQDGQELLVRRNRGGEIVQRALLQGAEIAELGTKNLHSTPDKFKYGMYLSVSHIFFTPRLNILNNQVFT